MSENKIYCEQCFQSYSPHLITHFKSKLICQACINKLISLTNKTIQNQCERCLIAGNVFRCEQCKSVFCEQCSKELHKKGKFQFHLQQKNCIFSAYQQKSLKKIKTDRFLTLGTKNTDQLKKSQTSNDEQNKKIDLNQIEIKLKQLKNILILQKTSNEKIINETKNSWYEIENFARTNFDSIIAKIKIKFDDILQKILIRQDKDLQNLKKQRIKYANIEKLFHNTSYVEEHKFQWKTIFLTQKIKIINNKLQKCDSKNYKYIYDQKQFNIIQEVIESIGLGSIIKKQKFVPENKRKQLGSFLSPKGNKTIGYSKMLSPSCKDVNCEVQNTIKKSYQYIESSTLKKMKSQKQIKNTKQFIVYDKNALLQKFKN